MTDARTYYSELGVTLPGGLNTGSVSVRCFANPQAHKNDDRNASCSVALETGQWRCFACGAKGGAFDAAIALGHSRADAAELAKRHGLFPTDREQQRPGDQAPRANGVTKAGRLPSDAQVEEWQHSLVRDNELVSRLFTLRGWTREAIVAAGVGFDPDWKGRDGGPIVFANRDAVGRLVGVLRHQPNPERRRGKKSKAAPGSKRELFQAPESLPVDGRLHVVEGEGDVVSLTSLGLAAVGIPGAGSWQSDWASRFAGRNVVLVPDLDEQGRALMAQVASDLAPCAASVRMLDMDQGRSDGRDLGDLVAEAAAQGPEGLATARSLLQRRVDEARVIPKPSIEATDDLLAWVSDFVRSYVVLSEAQSVAVALWALHTHAIAAAESTPYLSITSAERESGKTRLLETLELLVARPWFTGKTTAAALARKTDADQPTLLLDESDTAFGGDPVYAETLRGVLNTGYRRGGKVTVCVGQSTDMTTRDFSTFGAKAIAGIGELPDTVASRSIPIRLKRRAPGESVERFKRKTAEARAANLRERMGVWSAQHQKRLDDASPEPLPELGDRAEEVWEPLLAIADLAGGNWPPRARAAAIQLSGHREADDSSSHGVLVLGAMRKAIESRESIPTAQLLEAINADEELPFGGWRKGDGLNARGLAKLLSPYGIKSGTIRAGDKTPKGYRRIDLEDAWTRYLPPPSGNPPHAPHAPHPQQATFPPHENPCEHRDVAHVADVADSQGRGANGATLSATHEENGHEELAASNGYEHLATPEQEELAERLIGRGW